jgi:hypothetical protein
MSGQFSHVLSCLLRQVRTQSSVDIRWDPTLLYPKQVILPSLYTNHTFTSMSRSIMPVWDDFNHPLPAGW